MQYQRDPAIVRRRIGTETVLVPIRTSTHSMQHIFALNETGAFVWETLANPISHDQLVAALVAEYEVDTDQAQLDITHLLQRFQEAELIKEVPDGVMPGNH